MYFTVIICFSWDVKNAKNARGNFVYSSLVSHTYSSYAYHKDYDDNNCNE